MSEYLERSQIAEKNFEEDYSLVELSDCDEFNEDPKNRPNFEYPTTVIIN